MTRIQIIVDSFENFRESYPLWSMIHIRWNELCFPGERWTDATSSILTMWPIQLVGLLNGSKNCADLCFMDGDYTIRITQTAPAETKVQLIGPNGAMDIIDDVDLCYFAKQVLSACGKLSKQYAMHSNSPQLQEVSDAANQLRRLIIK